MTDPVTQYAERVLSKDIVAGRLVRQACARHLRDLAEQEARGLEWRPEEAARTIEFFERFLCLPEASVKDAAEAEDASTDGEPFTLSGWQQFVVGSLEGWYLSTGRKRFSTAYIETGKGSGKTPLASGLAIKRLFDEKAAQCFACGVTRDQAKIAYADASKMVAASPHLRARIHETVGNLAAPSTGSFFRAIASERRGLDGKRVTLAVIDELHEHPSAVVIDKIRAGTKGRRNPLILELTNAGYDRNSVCWQHHEYSRQVLETTITNDHWFAFICQLDSCEACYAKGHLQPVDGCPDCDDWKTEGPHWLKANPNLGVSLPWQYLRDQVREAVGMPSKQSIVRRLNFCHWMEHEEVWIPADRWAECAGAHTADSLRGRDCVIGLDLSDRIDLSAAVVLFPRYDETEPLEIERVADLPDLDRGVGGAAADILRVKFGLDILTYFWLPKDLLAQRGREDGVAYEQWARTGALKATSGNVIDHREILDTIVNEIAARYRVTAIALDPARATQMSVWLQHHFGPDRVIEVSQAPRSMSDPAKTLEAMVLSRRLVHDRNPVMAWCVANAVLEQNRFGFVLPVKKHQRQRIDGVSALTTGLNVLLRQQTTQRSVYEERGIIAF